jgi:hypothetical protein
MSSSAFIDWETPPRRKSSPNTAEAANAAKPLLNEQGLGTLPLVTDAAIAKANNVLGQSKPRLRAERRLNRSQS